MSVKDLISKAVVYARPDDSIKKVAEIMYSNNVGSVLILDESNRLVGIFTERDLVRVVALGIDLNKPVKEVMSTKVITASLNDSIVDAANKMLENWIRHLPVVDEKGRPVGVVSIRDVLKAYAASCVFP